MDTARKDCGLPTTDGRAPIAAGVVLALLAVSGCGGSDNAPPAADGQKLNSATPLATPAPDSPAGDAEADDPQTGLNTQRPDSPKDLKPQGP